MIRVIDLLISSLFSSIYSWCWLQHMLHDQMSGPPGCLPDSWKDLCVVRRWFSGILFPSVCCCCHVIAGVLFRYLVSRRAASPAEQQERDRSAWMDALLSAAECSWGWTVMMKALRERNPGLLDSWLKLQFKFFLETSRNAWHDSSNFIGNAAP